MSVLQHFVRYIYRISSLSVTAVTINSNVLGVQEFIGKLD